MRKEQLGEAVGRVDQTLLAEAMSYRGTPCRRRWGRVALVAACVTALLTVTAVAALSGNWNFWTVPVDQKESAQTKIVGSELLWGRATLTAHPLSEEVMSRVHEEAGTVREYDSVSDLEKSYGIRLLRVGIDAEDLKAYAGAELLPPTADQPSGACVTGKLLTLGKTWGANISFQFSSVDSPSETRSGGMGYAVKRVEQITSYEIHTLGVPAQIVTVVYDSGEGAEHVDDVAFFSYGNIAYSVSFFDLTGNNHSADWICSMLELLHD